MPETLFRNHDGVDLLRRLVDFIRPRRELQREAGLRELIRFLRANRECARKFKQTVRETAGGLRFIRALVESGVLPERGVLAGIRKQLGAAVLPLITPDDDLRPVLLKIFSRRSDWEWVQAVPDSLWEELLEFVVEARDTKGWPHKDTAFALRALAQKIGATGIDEEVLQRIGTYDSPFLELSASTQRFLEDHRRGAGSKKTFRAVADISRACRETVMYLRTHKAVYGTSVRLTGVTRRLLQQLNRFDLLLCVVHPRKSGDFVRAVVPLMKDLIQAEQTMGDLRRLVDQNLDLLAFQVTEHTADKGEKYIGRTVGEYLAFLMAAMGGGALVAVFAVLKLFLSGLDLPLAAEAVVYGLNYSICFILIYVTGAILATKQPAVTASTIARLIDGSSERTTALRRIADTIVLVWRSQFVSFLGNILCAFPAALCIGYLLEHSLGIRAADDAKALKLLGENHPLESPALLYAAFAGVFLFVAGVIQGAVENRIVYVRFEERLKVHPGLQFLGRFRDRFIRFVVKHASGVVGNTALGFLLGSAGTVGIIFGVPFDIRHIAFSASHFGVVVLDAPELVDLGVVYSVMLGIIGIGFVNFFVSFGLTLYVTFRSRDVSFGQGRALLWILFRRFLSGPFEWFLPVGRAGIEADTLKQ